MKYFMARTFYCIGMNAAASLAGTDQAASENRLIKAIRAARRDHGMMLFDDDID
jgi:hypothetical protein